MSFKTWNDIGIEIFPDSERIKYLISNAFQELFGATKIIHFEEDRVSSDDLEFFKELQQSKKHGSFEISIFEEGNHNAPCTTNKERILDLAREVSSYFESHIHQPHK